MLFGWKEFSFFDSVPISDPSSGSSPLYSDPELLDIAPGSNDTVFMSTRTGFVREFNRDLELVSQFEVCDPEWGRTPDFIRAVPGTRLLVTVAPKLGQPVEVTVWNLAHSPPDVNTRLLVKNGGNTYPLTAFTMAPDLSSLLFGFGDGAVIVVKGDIMHDRGSRQRLIHTASSGVTGLALSASQDQVFVASLNQIVLASPFAGPLVLDKSKGADLGCAVYSGDDEFLVARESEIATYNTKHRGPSFEIDIEKKRVFLTHGGKYLVMVSMYEVQSQSLLSANTIRVVIVDLSNHLVVFNAHLANGVKAIFEQWQRLNILGSDGVLYSLKEKPLSARISALKTQNLYQVAIKMATQELGSSSATAVLSLHQDFAEYLFEKNDVDAALKEYIAAIDLDQSSRVVRRFKGSQYAATLVEYLNALYIRGKSTPQHAMLQIICYTKLDKVNELEEFLKSAVEMPGFDFEQAIGVLAEMHVKSYSELAASLAMSWPDPDLVVQIRLRQLDDVQGVLDYIQTVSPADALRLLIQNSRYLLNRLPIETTGVLITLFTGKFVTRQTTQPASEPLANNAPVIQSYQAFIKYLSSKNYLGSHIVSAETLETDVPEPSYLPPRPRLIFPSFIGHDNEFVIFLEACLKSAPSFHSSEKDMNDIATTLFETYLKLGDKERASKLIDDYHDVLERVNILTVSQIFHFRPTSKQFVALGSTYADVFREAINNGDIDEALNVLYNHVGEDRDMALQAIRLLTTKKDVLSEIRTRPGELNKVFNTVTRSGISHVQLLSELSASPYLVVGDIRPFVSEFLQSTNQQVERHTKLAQSYRDEISDKKKAIEKQNELLVFQNGKCDQCRQPLELPAIHFACKHSYHRRCLAQRTECPVCLPENESLDVLNSQNEETAAKQEYFIEELGKKDDKLKVISDFISRGALSRIS